MSRISDYKYLGYVRRLPCSSCHATDCRRQVHHRVGGREGLRTGDGEVMPLCARCHSSLHGGGYLRWEELHGVTQELHILKTRGLVMERWGHKPPPRDTPYDEILPPFTKRTPIIKDEDDDADWDLFEEDHAWGR